MTFQEFKDPTTGAIRSDVVYYVDVNGLRWTVPEGHRFWDLYQEWLSEGNTLMPAT